VDTDPTGHVLVVGGLVIVIHEAHGVEGVVVGVDVASTHLVVVLVSGDVLLSRLQKGAQVRLGHYDWLLGVVVVLVLLSHLVLGGVLEVQDVLSFLGVAWLDEGGQVLDAVGSGGVVQVLIGVDGGVVGNLGSLLHDVLVQHVHLGIVVVFRGNLLLITQQASLGTH
jgi:hypothetical protein